MPEKLALGLDQFAGSGSVFRTFRERRTSAGKPIKAALIATALKLLVTLNAMIAISTDYDTATAS